MSSKLSSPLPFKDYSTTPRPVLRADELIFPTPLAYEESEEHKSLSLPFSPRSSNGDLLEAYSGDKESQFEQLCHAIFLKTLKLIQLINGKEDILPESLHKKFMTKKEVSEINPDLTNLIERCHSVMKLRFFDSHPQAVNLLEKYDFYCLSQDSEKSILRYNDKQNLLTSPSSVLNIKTRMKSPVQTKRELGPPRLLSPKEFPDELPVVLGKDIPAFVLIFNSYFEALRENRKAAFAILENLRNSAWEFENGLPKIPIATEIGGVRMGLFVMFRCKDHDIRERALNYLIELLECDPLELKSSDRLIELQLEILETIQANSVQNFNKHIQRLLIKAYAETIECVLLHVASHHRSAVTEQLKDDSWTGAENLNAFNSDGDEEIKFWTNYAIQAAQHLTTNVAKWLKCLTRLGLIARAGLRLGSALNNPVEGAAGLSEVYKDIKEAFRHIEIHKTWFEELLILKKLCRYSINNWDEFKNIAYLIKKCKNNYNNEILLYGLVSILEQVVLTSSNPKIQEEGIKTLIQFFHVDASLIQSRVFLAFSHLLQAEGEDKKRMRNTALIVIRLLQTYCQTQLQEEEQELLKNNFANLLNQPLDHFEDLCERRQKEFSIEHLFTNAIKFFLRRIADIKQQIDYGGQSFVTLLASSKEERIAALMLKSLVSISKKFEESDVQGNTPYHVSVLHGNREMIRSVHSNMQISINAQNYKNGDTALHLSVQSTDLTLTPLLLDLNADPNISNFEGYTPLHLIAQQGHVFRAEMLLRKGANPNVVSLLRETAMDIAIKKNDCFMMIMLGTYRGTTSKAHTLISLRKLALDYGSKDIVILINKIIVVLKGEKIKDCGDFNIETLRKLALEKNISEFKIFCTQEEIQRNDFERSITIKSIKPNPPLPLLSTPLDVMIELEEEKEGEEQKEEDVVSFPQVSQSLVAIPEPKHHSLRSVNLHVLETHALKEDEEAIKITLNHSPELFWHKGDSPYLLFQGMIRLQRQKSVRAFVNWAKTYGLVRLHLESIKLTKNQTPLSHLLASADDAVAFEGLIRDDRLIGYHADASLMNYTPLHMAAINGSLNILSVYIKHKMDLNRQDAFGNTAAHLAGLNSKFQFISTLQNAKANMRVKNRDGRTPTHLAATRKSPQTLMVLTSEVSRAAEMDANRELPLHLACSNPVNDSEAIYRHLAEIYPSSIHAPNDDENTPLHLVCSTGKLKAAEYFISKKANIEAQNIWGETPFHLAAQEGHLDIINYLITQQVDTRARDADGEIPIHKAVCNLHYLVVIRLLEVDRKLLRPDSEAIVHIEDSKKETVIHKLSKKKISPLYQAGASSAILTALLKEGADIDKRNWQGENVFHLICQNGHFDLFTVISACFESDRARKNYFAQQDNRGNTCLHKSVLGNKSQIVRGLLTSKCVDIDARNKSKMTPLMQAAHLGLYEIALLLLQNGADPTLTIEKKNLLHFILEKKHLVESDKKLLSYLFTNYPKLIVDRDNKKKTPLHLLAENNHTIMLKLLLKLYPENLEKKKRYIWKQDEGGLTAAELATQNKHYELASKLKNLTILEEAVL